MDLGVGLKRFLTKGQKNARMLADLKTNPKSKYAKLSDAEKNNLIRLVYKEGMNDNELFDAIRNQIQSRRNFNTPEVKDYTKSVYDYDYNEPFDKELYSQLTKPNTKLEQQADKILKEDDYRKLTEEDRALTQKVSSQTKDEQLSDYIDSLTKEDLPSLRNRMIQYNEGKQSSLSPKIQNKLKNKYLELLLNDEPDQLGYDLRQAELDKLNKQQYAIDRMYDEQMNPEKYRYRKAQYDPRYSQRSQTGKVPYNPEFTNYEDPRTEDLDRVLEYRIRKEQEEFQPYRNFNQEDLR